MTTHLDPETSGVRPGPSEHRLPCRDEKGQALVEFALVLPLLILLVGVAFNGWNGMQRAIRLTSAARAGAIAAANDMAAGDSQLQIEKDATADINAEEGGGNVYQYKNSSAPDFVTVTRSPSDVLISGVNGVTISTVEVTISPSPITLIPFVESISVATHATARYS